MTARVQSDGLDHCLRPLARLKVSLYGAPAPPPARVAPRLVRHDPFNSLPPPPTTPRSNRLDSLRIDSRPRADAPQAALGTLPSPHRHAQSRRTDFRDGGTSDSFTLEPGSGRPRQRRHPAARRHPRGEQEDEMAARVRVALGSRRERGRAGAFDVGHGWTKPWRGENASRPLARPAKLLHEPG